MVQNKQGSSLCSVPHHNESVLSMTQNESDGEGKITAQNCPLRNKGQPVILRKKTALPVTVTQELVAQASTFFKEQVERTASFSSRGNQNFLFFKHTLEKSIIYISVLPNYVVSRAEVHVKNLFFTFVFFIASMICPLY